MSYERDNECCCTVLCDSGNDNEPFYRCFEEVCLPGQPVERIPVDYELDRETPYSVIGQAIICQEPIIWSKILCDIQGTFAGIEILTFDGGESQRVQRMRTSDLAILDFHTPDPAIDWAHASIYDPTNGFYYLLDQISGDWHRYDSLDLAAGSTNLGPFAGDAIVGGLFYGAYDHVTGLGYVGSTNTRYEINFGTLTVTQIPTLTYSVGPFPNPTSMSITPNGTHYVTVSTSGSSEMSFHSVDVLSGVCTLLGGPTPGVVLNGGDYDFDTETGFYGMGSGFLYTWTNPDGSDLTLIGPSFPTGTLAVARVAFDFSKTPFERVSQFDPITGIITTQDYDLDGANYIVQGEAVLCEDENETCPIPVGILCERIKRECDDAPANDYGPWQGGSGDQPVISNQILCTGESLNITWNNFVAGQITNSAMSQGNSAIDILVSGGPGVTETLTLAWDVDLRGPFAFTITDVTPGDENIPSISPSPSSITPIFGEGDVNTIHQVYYEDITGISQIEIDLEIITQSSGTFIVQMDENVPLSTVLEEYREIIIYADTCQDSPVLTYYYNSTGEQILDIDVISGLTQCVSPGPFAVAEEEVCVTIANQQFQAIKRTVFTPDPVDKFIGSNGSILTPDFWTPGNCDQQDVSVIIAELNTGETWTPALIPAGKVLTGMSVNIINSAVDSVFTDANGNTVNNLPTGLSMSWNVNSDRGILQPPQLIDAGTGGRIVINITYRDQIF